MVIATLLFAQKTISIDDFTSQNESLDPERIQTVLGAVDITRISAFGGPLMTYTMVKDEFAFMMGGGGGIILNNVFFGGYGIGTTNYVTVNNDNGFDDLAFRHGGFWLGYEIAHQRLIHPVISSKIGWGSAEIENSGTDNVFVVAPAIAAEINFTRYFKVNVGVEYCKTFGVSGLGNYSDKDFSNLGVNLNFVFGWF